jgi:hypothetical protein
VRRLQKRRLNVESQVDKNEDVVRTREMSVHELELALKVAKKASENQGRLELLLVPPELKHLNHLEWEIVANLLVSLEWEKGVSRVH